MLMCMQATSSDEEEEHALPSEALSSASEQVLASASAAAAGADAQVPVSVLCIISHCLATQSAASTSERLQVLNCCCVQR